MARITVEDCLKNVNNRFDLVLKASKRARELSLGAEATLPWDNDKPTVMALREIAENTILTRELEASEHFDIDMSGGSELGIEETNIELDAEAELGDAEILSEDGLPKSIELSDEISGEEDEA